MVAGSTTVTDFDSTLIRTARDAVTFSEMRDFAEQLENRPLAQLLEELPALAKLSNAKFDVATSVLRRRFRSESEIHQAQLKIFGGEIADRAGESTVGRRIRGIFER